MNHVEQLEKLQEEYSSCSKCPQLCESRTKIVFGVGNPKADILVIAEAPGAEEDKIGIPLIGQSGKILDWFLANIMPDDNLNRLTKSFSMKGGFRRMYDWPDHNEAKKILCERIFYTNSILCRPENNRDPEIEELENCRARLFETIYLIDPLVIVSVGRISLESIMGKKVTSILKTRGNMFDIKLPGRLTDIYYPVMPILHPSYLMRQGFDSGENGPWDLTRKDLEKVISLLK